MHSVDRFTQISNIKYQISKNKKQISKNNKINYKMNYKKDNGLLFIDTSGCKMRGEVEFDIDNPNNDAITNHNNFGPVVFSLEKPL